MKQDEELSGLGKAFRIAGPYINASYTLIAAIAMFGLAGWWIDGKLDTKPFILIVGLFFGLGIGFYNFIKILMRLDKKEQ